MNRFAWLVIAAVSVLAAVGVVADQREDGVPDGVPSTEVRPDPRVGDPACVLDERYSTWETADRAVDPCPVYVGPDSTPGDPWTV
jgi:hypothetical protein